MITLKNQKLLINLVDVDVNDHKTAQTQAYSLKEIICSLLAGNGIKLLKFTNMFKS